LWQRAVLRFRLDDETTDHPVATLTIDTPAGRLFVMAEAVQSGRTMLLSGLHVHGEHTRANRIGAANLLVLIPAFMELMDVDELVVTGGTRTTGAHPGQTPRRIRFARRADD
jgi:hypothetical protein